MVVSRGNPPGILTQAAETEDMLRRIAALERAAGRGGGGGGAVGEITMWGGAGTGAALPTGKLVCDGSAVSRTTYDDLFAIIGEAYGPGDGSTTFNLPDGLDNFARGIAPTETTRANTAPTSSALSTHNHGITVASANANHGHNANSGNQSSSHTHTVNIGNQTSNHTHNYVAPNSGVVAKVSSGVSANHGHNRSVGNNSANHSHAITVAAANAAHAHNGSAADTDLAHPHTIGAMDVVFLITY